MEPRRTKAGLTRPRRHILTPPKVNAAVHNVLFLCTGNSARSILAEVLLNEIGAGQYRAYSAGSQPVGRVNPGALDVLQANGHAVNGLRSKSWDEFSGDAAVVLDTVVTVCDNAAAESCPVWNGAPQNLHWGLPDPAAFDIEEERSQAFASTYRELKSRIAAFVETAKETP